MVDDDFDELIRKANGLLSQPGPNCGVAGDLYRQAVVSLKAKLEQAQPNNMEAEEIKHRLLECHLGLIGVRLEMDRQAHGITPYDQGKALGEFLEETARRIRQY